MLRAEVSTFVGRRTELADVRRMLAAGRLLTITGPGGVGKSRIVQHLVGQFGADQAALVRIVELGALREPSKLLAAVAAECGVQHELGAPPEADVTLLGAALKDRPWLLVLDCCDHLVDATAELATSLLTTTSRLRILVTSRQVLGVAGEQVLRLAGLPVQPAAIALFADRAAASTPGFVMDDRNQTVVVDICRRLDGLPLAVELAAIWTRSVPLAEIQRQLDNGVGLLTRGPRSAPPRQRTLARSMAWSYDVCGPAEGLLWSRLSVFRGEFAMPAAVAVCADDALPAEEIPGAISGLVDKSLLVISARPGRYAMLNTIRRYGQDHLVADADRRWLARRYRDHFIGIAHRASADWFGDGQPALLADLKQEHTNLRAILEFDPADAGQRRSACRTAALLEYYWRAGGLIREGLHHLTAAISPAEDPEGGCARAWWVAARLSAVLHGPDVATAMAERAVALAGRDSEPGALGSALSARGFAALVIGENANAAGYYQRAVASFRQAGVESCDLVISWAEWGLVLAFAGEHTRSAQLLRPALHSAKAHGDQWARSWVRYSCGVLAWLSGNLDAAQRHARAGMRGHRQFDDQLGRSVSLELMAWIAGSGGDHERAAELLGAARRADPVADGELILSMRGNWLEPHQTCVLEAKAALGEATFLTAVQHGFAQDTGAGEGPRQAPGDVSPSAPAGFQALTRREREVAGLVAEGRTNKEIASRLVISPRTAETHVNRALTKLGFTSRSQLADWAASRDR